MSAAPYTRSRTLLFLSYRDSAARPSAASSTSSAAAYYATPDLESRALLSDLDGASGGGGGNLSLPPQWVDVAEKVDMILVAIRPKLDKLDKLHSKHLLPGFKDRSLEEREIESLANEITSDFRKTQSHIRHIAQISSSLLKKPGGSGGGSRAELIMAANVQTALATKVQELSGLFRKKQTGYLRRLRGQASPMPGTPSAGGFSGNPTVDPLLSLASDESYLQSVQTQSSASTRQVDQRTTEILSLAQSITDLSDLFKDLNSLVLDQGTVLDRIDWNVEQMAGEVEGAVRELKAAQGHQRSSGKCQLIFLLILLIFGAILLLVYRPHGRSSSTNPSISNFDKGDSATPLPAAGDLDLGGGMGLRWRPRGRRRQ